MRLVSSNVDLNTWRAIGTRNGGEAVVVERAARHRHLDRALGLSELDRSDAARCFVVAELAVDWSLVVGRTFEDGTEARLRGRVTREGRFRGKYSSDAGQVKVRGRVRGRRLRLDSLWVNLLRPGGSHSGHIHPHSVVSGTVYIAVPQGSGALKLEVDTFIVLTDSETWAGPHAGRSVAVR